MNKKRILELLEDFRCSLLGLEEALKGGPEKQILFMDGTLRRYLISFDLAWKLLKGILRSRGTDVEGLKEVIHESASLHLIGEEVIWMEMLNDRNRVLYACEDKEIRVSYNRIKNQYYPNLVKLKNKIKELLVEE
ncbi:MAG: nucleotidyltransferase substrate binding protein [Candidatus Aureabacteria bacterium]|nr:nucleotidyltransferase substrate binding protein [Candidatus Auribacterota bacterium]